MSTIQSRDDLSWQSVLMRIGIIVVCTIIITITMPQSSAPQYNSKVGSPWTQAAVTATFDFEIPKDSATYKAECDSVRRRFAPYYTYHESTAKTQVQRFLTHNHDGIDGLPASYVPNNLVILPPFALILLGCIIWVHRACDKDLQEK